MIHGTTKRVHGGGGGFRENAVCRLYIRGEKKNNSITRGIMRHAISVARENCARSGPNVIDKERRSYPRAEGYTYVCTHTRNYTRPSQSIHNCSVGEKTREARLRRTCSFICQIARYVKQRASVTPLDFFLALGSDRRSYIAAVGEYHRAK